MIDTTSTAPQDLTEMSPQDMPRYLAEVAAPLLAKQSQEKFDAVLRNIVRRQLGEGDGAAAAAASGSFMFDGQTAVVRLNRQTDCVEIYIDMGLPGPSVDHAQVFGMLLEMNLNGAHYGVLFGRNEKSKRLVASLKVHIALMDGDGDFCMECLQMLSQATKSVRTW